MAAKAVLNVAVNNTQLKAAATQVQNIQQFVKTLPPLLQKTNQWGRYNTQTYRLWAQHVKQAQQAAAQTTTNIQTAVVASSKLSNHWMAIAKHAKAMHKEFKEATHLMKSVWKWSAMGTITSGLLGVGSLFGLARLSAGVAGDRKMATGLGVPIGAMKAFNLNMGRFLTDPSALLGAMQEAQADPRAHATAMAVTGLRGFGGNPVEMASEFIKRLRSAFPMGTKEQNWGVRATAQGFTEVPGMDLQTIARIIDARKEEVEAQFTKMKKDEESFKLADKLAQEWNDLTDQLKRAGDQIEHTFITGLQPLVTPINELSSAFADLAHEVLESAKKEGWIVSLKDQITSFTAELKTPAFKQGVEDFTKGVIGMANVLGRFVKLFAPAKEGEPPATGPGSALTNTWRGMGSGASESIETLKWLFDKIIQGPPMPPTDATGGGWIVGQHTPSVRVANNTSNRLLVIETGAGSSYNVAAQQVSVG